MSSEPEKPEPGDLLVCCGKDFGLTRRCDGSEMYEEELIGRHIVTRPGVHCMFVRDFHTDGRPDGMLVFVPSEGAHFCAVRSKWRVLKRCRAR